MTAYDQAELAQALLSEIGDALFLVDPETDQLLEVNPVAIQLTGYSHPELTQFTASYLFRFEASGGIQRLKGAFTKTMVFHGQDGFLVRAKDDSWIPVSLTVSRLHVSPKPIGLIVARDDRERRAALTKTRRIEAELRTVLSSSPAALWSAERAPGPDVFAGWQFRYVSPLLARIAGRPATFFDHPFKWAEVIHPQERDIYRTALRRLLTSGEEFELLYRVEALHGEVRWVRDRLQVVYDASNRPTRLDGCITDVTEQRHAEDALRASEERFRALVEKSRDGVLLLDAKGNIHYATPASKLILGFDPDVVVGTEAFAFIHPDDIPSARKRFALSLRRPGEEVPSTFRAIAADNSVRMIEMTSVNRLDDPSVNAVVANYRDVTERAAALREIAQQNTLLEGIFASVPDIICYKDRNGVILGCNPAFESFAGKAADELTGKVTHEVFGDDWAKQLRAKEETVLSTGRTGRAKEWVTYPDGRKTLLDIAVAPLRGNAGAIIGLIFVGRDVTEQDQLEEALRQSHKMEAVGRLAGGIAHDFNNLLTVVLGNLELIRCGAATGDEVAEMLLSTERAAKHAAELTKQMLGFARRQPLRTATVDLNALVRESLDLLRRTIDPRITVQFNQAEDLYPVAADPVQVQQVLMNLCLNARDAMPEGGTLTLETANADRTLEDSSAEEFVRLSVSDTGMGMSEEVREKIFDPFFTTKGIGQGTGLGLAVVYGVAKAHGGAVEVHSSPGAGSRFDVYLPRGIESDEVDTVQNAERNDIPRGNGETVLVADDEAGVRELAKVSLEIAGYQVLVAADGAEALAMFREANGSVQLAVLDASMPRLSGRQVFEAIRQIDPNVKVLFASGFHGSGLLPEDGLPGTRRLHKPYVPSQLATVVREMLASDPATATAPSV